MRTVTRPLTPAYGQEHPGWSAVWPAGRRPCPSAAGVPFFLPQGPIGPNQMPFCGMDPSDPRTYVRPWNPQPGMIARLNFDGANMQDDADMGGLWNRPARFKRKAAKRPKRRAR